MDDSTYFFVDLNYAKQAYRKAMTDIFGVADDPAPQNLLAVQRFQRAYVYDCPAEKRSDESEDDFEVRRKAQEAYFDEFRDAGPVHVQLGTVRGRKARQKEVDVLLAVDMMTHGFNKTMTHAVLLAGDLDFRPVVDSLVRAGVFVHVMYEELSGSKELRVSADYGIRLTWQQLYNWGREAFRTAHPVPRVTKGVREHLYAPVESGTIRQPGKSLGIPVLLIQSGNTWQILIENWDEQRIVISHGDEPVLQRYVNRFFAPIQWTGRRSYS
jgi:uncharacterized LabA/DUF88 family protein